MEIKKQKTEEDFLPETDQREFLIDILTEMEGLKNFIYNGSDVAAYKYVQRITDKIKDKIRKL